ncbi:MAG: ATP-dependent DNA helicase RecG [Armatimonadetes bacterium]|nr:ATP-dependent DNA helicase RecG [Armatimonadota bacterium]
MSSAPGPHKRTLDDEIQYLKGVGPRNAGLLAKVGIKTVRDILFHLPRRYEDRTKLPKMQSLRSGDVVTVRGKLLGLETKQVRGGMVILRAVISDGTGTVGLTWFNQPWVKKALEGFKGEIIAFGQVKESGWTYDINSPEYEKVDPEDEAEGFQRIMPVYPLSEGLPQWVVRKAAVSALQTHAELLEESLPAAIQRTHGLMSLELAIQRVHRPESLEDVDAARRRMVFEEFLWLQLALGMKRNETHRESGEPFPISKMEGLWDEIHRMLPFELTGAQKRVIGEIFSDLEAPFPMNRLLQGDVGSGKTAVAAAAMLAAVRCGYQAALMAPTEILAEQHRMNLESLFAPLGIEVALLVGRQTSTERRKALAHTETGKAGIVIGTHALIQEGVRFHKLGFVVIDEQHRFGVLQRAALKEKGYGNPDVLVMTATPIPRTLTMTLYGDLDVSVIDELPPGRKPIKTHWKVRSERDSVYEGVRKLIEGGRQAYIVCPLVADSEKMLAQAAEDLHYRLTHETYPDFAVGLLHGQMKPKEKDDVMARFRAGEVQVLVSTTVIEVGVDVPNASVMVVEDANRFGLSQLHQLRGRVGRGSAQSFCVLLGDGRTEDAQARLSIMSETTDGFRIAEEDLKLRGPGELLGTKQAGSLGLKVADLLKDGRVLEEARQAAMRILENDPGLSQPDHAALREGMLRLQPERAAVITS